MTNQRVDTPLKRIIGARGPSWLVNHAESYIELQANKYNGLSRQRGWFSPSDLHNPCDAYLAFRYMAVEQRSKVSARLQRIFDVGNAADARIKDMLRECGLSVIPAYKPKPSDTSNDIYWGEKRLRQFELPDWRIKGEYDDKVQNPITREKFIVEIKTMNTDEFQALKAPKEDHIIQVQPYLYHDKEVAGVYFLYEDKNTQDWKPFVQGMDSGVWNATTDRLAYILDCLDKGEMPMRRPQQYETRCQFHWTCSAFDMEAHIALKEQQESERAARPARR